MISIEPFNFFIIYFGCTLTAVLMIWLIFEWRRKKESKRQALQELTICEYCHFPYLFFSFYKVHRCPQCQSYNKKGTD